MVQFGKNLPDIKQYRYREALIEWLIFHENIYYQRKKGLLDTEINDAWKRDLVFTVNNHNLELVSPNIKKLFPGKFWRHITRLRKAPINTP